jgi:alpha-D-xyloside xylohydrolase
MKSSLLLSIVLAAGLLAPARALAAPIPVVSVHQDADGVTLKMNPGVMKLQVFAPDAVRVVYVPGDKLPAMKSLSVIARPVRKGFKMVESASDLRLQTDKLEVRVNRASGAVGFYDAAGNAVLLENADGGKSLAQTNVGLIETLRSTQAFERPADEAVYGLGQHQQGLMNYRNTTVKLQQKNMEVGVPVLVSSRGYGVLWDNPAVTTVSTSDGESNAPGELTWSSEAADGIDYYFMYGPELDGVIGAYRQLTGAAPMFGKWAWGFWQCKERYQSQLELLDIAGRYRSMHVPLDGVIQDWRYWDPHPWGSHEFDTNRYPDPAGMMAALHAENVHLLISVWPKFDLGSANSLELAKAGALYTNVISYVYPPGKGQWYDPFNPVARRVYWRQMSRELFNYGIDGWWLDASEPELSGKWGEYRSYQTAAGPGARVFNAYPLMHTTSIYEGQRAENSDKRVFILTRSAYAGQQRNSAVTWSGDIQGTWNVLAREIPAGLNFSLSGIPYWNTDTGGFFVPRGSTNGYQELFTRWFQFSAFCPMFRVHGTDRPKEMWRFDDATQKILIQYDELRYHLMPYIYSVSWQVTSAGYSMMRGLVMDFRADTNVYDLKDQYMFGPALMANPVTHAGTTTRSVYLPAGSGWVDFWTGEPQAGGQTVETAAPIETMPLFVRAGSIIPYGPEIEFATAKADPIELRVYRGANGNFTLYEDEGDNYNYEKGAYATIPISWDESAHALTIGQRQGSFRGMLKERTFRVVWVSAGHGAGVESTVLADSEVHYTGAEVKVAAPK